MRRIAVVFLLLLFCMGMLSCSDDLTSNEIRIYFLDVGQGDAALIRTADGDVLIDTGTEDSQELLCLRLEQLGVSEIKLMILSHNDEDHIGGADGVLSRFSVSEIWVNGAPMESNSADRLLESATQKHVPIRAVCAMQKRCIGDTYFTVLSPLSHSNVESGNADSLVLKVTFGRVGMLFSGDTDMEREQELLDYYEPAIFDCDLYKVAHHGSNDASGEAILRAITPHYAVISCEAANDYGHPSGETLLRLGEIGAEVFRTDLHGEIVFLCDGVNLQRYDGQ